MGQFFDKGLLMRGGQANVLYVMDKLMELVEEGKIGADDIVTRRMRLSEGAEAYDIFCNKKDGCIKVLMRP